MTAGLNQLMKRRRAIVAMFIVGTGLVTGAVITSFVVAYHHGYGTWFGSGRLLPEYAEPFAFKGTGILGDTILLIVYCLINVALILGWGYLASNLSSEPIEPPNQITNNNDWYIVPMPSLTKVTVCISIVCMVGILALDVTMLASILIYYGW